MSMNEPMSWPAFLLILLFIYYSVFGKRGTGRGGYTRSAPSPKGLRPKPPGTPQRKETE